MVFTSMVVFPYFSYSLYEIAIGKRKDQETRKRLEIRWILSYGDVSKIAGVSVFLEFPIGKLLLETLGNSEVEIRYTMNIRDNRE